MVAKQCELSSGLRREKDKKKQSAISAATHRLPLKSNNFPFIYQSTDGSGTPFGGVQFKTTGPPTKATVSFGTNLKSSRNTEMRKKTQKKKIKEIRLIE